MSLASGETRSLGATLTVRATRLAAPRNTTEDASLQLYKYTYPPCTHAHCMQVAEVNKQKPSALHKQMSRSNIPVAVQRGRCEKSGKGNDLPPATLWSKLNFRSTVVLISEVFQLGHRSLHMVHRLQRQLFSILLLLVIGSRGLRCHDNCLGSHTLGSRTRKSRTNFWRLRTIAFSRHYKSNLYLLTKLIGRPKITVQVTNQSKLHTFRHFHACLILSQ